MDGSFQPTLAAGKAELVRDAEGMHVIGRAERTRCVQRLGVLSRIQSKTGDYFYTYCSKPAKLAQKA